MAAGGGGVKEPMGHSTKQIALAILPKPSAILSIAGSALIVYNVCKRRRRRRQGESTAITCSFSSATRVNQLLLLMMSLGDIIGSICFFLGTWPIPSALSNQIYGASGTRGTCTAQGFFLLLGMPLSFVGNACLSVSYVLTIRYNWTEERLRRYALPFFALSAASVSCCGAFIALAKDVFGPRPWWCWIGTNGTMYAWVLGFGPLWLCFFISITSMALVYSSVSKVENRSFRWNSRHSVAVNSVPVIRFQQHQLPDESKTSTTVVGAERHITYNTTAAAADSDNDAKDLHVVDAPAESEEPKPRIVRFPVDAGGEEDFKENPIHEHAREDSSNSNNNNRGEGAIDSGSLNCSVSLSSHRSSLPSTWRRVSLSKEVSFSRSRMEFDDDLKSRQVAMQAYFYMFAFISSWTTGTVLWLMHAAGVGPPPYWLLVIHTLTNPLQGLLNALVYIRPRYMKNRRNNPDMSRFRAVISVAP